ncbi:hypothetical protein V9K67_01485 [Paraflavisolibacter sp. H34]|uniref:hypothetical protein n=1 Tax=Huijunlia imazamoxiresistens TaxID=3127457 RepID=UPI003019D91B
MNKFKTFGGILFFLLLGSSVKAQRYKNAAGIRFSTNAAVINNALSFKHFFTGSTALEGLLSFDPLAIGLLVEKHNAIGPTGLDWFIGGGAYVGFSQRKNLGAQGVLGLDYKIPSLPLNFSLDWKPELNLLKDTFFEPAAVGVSARFAF